MARRGIRFHSLETERQIAKEYLSGVDVKILMAKYGYKTRKSITDKVKKFYPDFDFVAFNKEKVLNGKNYKLDFTIIDSPFTAYFLGLMVTDGYISSETQFGIDLVDEDCIAFISKSTGKTYSTYPRQTDKHQPRHRIIFSDRDNVKQLKRYNIVRRKTHIIKGFNFLLKEYQYIPYFIRGVIDGDGYIGKTNYGKLYFSISSSSKEWLEWIIVILRNHMFMYELEGMYKDTNKVYSITTALKRNIDILKLLSYDRPFGMMRKYNKLYEKGSETVIETS